jgi:hypothetical protein
VRDTVTPSHGAPSLRAAATSEPATHRHVSPDVPSATSARLASPLMVFPQQQWQWSCAPAARARGPPAHRQRLARATRLFRSPSSRVSGKDLCHAAASPTPAFSAAAIAAVPASGSVTRRSRDAARLARGTLWCPSQLDCSIALPSLCSASALAAAALVRPAPCSGYVHVVPRPRARQLLFWVTDGTAVVCLVNAAVL